MAQQKRLQADRLRVDSERSCHGGLRPARHDQCGAVVGLPAAAKDDERHIRQLPAQRLQTALQLGHGNEGCGGSPNSGAQQLERCSVVRTPHPPTHPHPHNLPHGPRSPALYGAGLYCNSNPAIKERDVYCSNRWQVMAAQIYCFLPSLLLRHGCMCPCCREDKVFLAAAWLYRATNDDAYNQQAYSHFQQAGGMAGISPYVRQDRSGPVPEREQEKHRETGNKTGSPQSTPDCCRALHSSCLQLGRPVRCRRRSDAGVSAAGGRSPVGVCCWPCAVHAGSVDELHRLRSLRFPASPRSEGRPASKGTGNIASLWMKRSSAATAQPQASVAAAHSLASQLMGGFCSRGSVADAPNALPPCTAAHVLQETGAFAGRKGGCAILNGAREQTG